MKIEKISACEQKKKEEKLLKINLNWPIKKSRNEWKGKRIETDTKKVFYFSFFPFIDETKIVLLAPTTASDWLDDNLHLPSLLVVKISEQTAEAQQKMICHSS